MGTITAETTLTFIWKDDPAFVGSSDVLTGCVCVWNDCSAYPIISSISIIDSLSVVGRIIEFLANYTVIDSIYYVHLIEARII